ncbi:MAG: hypothetical protein ACRC2T_05655 [Thermoguttaceae bacterium]
MSRFVPILCRNSSEALNEFCYGMKGEAKRVGLNSEEDVNELVAQIRKELRSHYK